MCERVCVPAWLACLLGGIALGWVIGLALCLRYGADWLW